MRKTTVKGSQPGIKSVEIVGRILRSLTADPNPQSLKVLAAKAGLSGPKLHRYLISLMRVGLVKQDEETRCYSLGSFCLELGNIAVQSNDPLVDATERMQRLREKIDETITLSIWSPHGPVIIDVADSGHPVTMTMKRGTVLPMLSTATGIVFSAFLPAFQTEHLVREELEAKSSNPIAKTQQQLARLMKKVRAQGFAVNSGHLLPDIMAIAAPVLDGGGSIIAVLGAIGSKDRIDPKTNPKALKALLSS